MSRISARHDRNRIDEGIIVVGVAEWPDHVSIPDLTGEAVTNERAEHGRNILPAEARSGV